MVHNRIYGMNENFPHKQKASGYGGQGVIEYILLLSLVALVVVAGLALTGGGIKKAIGGIAKPMGGTPVATAAASGGGETTFSVTVKPVDADGKGIQDVTVLLFDGQGNSLGKQQQTGEQGDAVFGELGSGSYAFRADFQGRSFWSEIVSVPATSYVEIALGERPVTVRVVNSLGTGLAEVPVFAFLESGQYSGASSKTDADGNAVLALADGAYKFRADYKGQPVWSETITSPDTTSVTIHVDEAPFTVKVSDSAGSPVKNVPVYAFNKDGGYTGLYGRTDAKGVVTLDLPDGIYQFRTDYQGRDYWSKRISSPKTNAVTIVVGPSFVTVRVVDGKGKGLPNLVVYAFSSDAKYYLGFAGRTDKNGNVVLKLKDGEYNFRADYKGARYWSGKVTVPDTSTVTINVGDGSLHVTVLADNNPVSGAHVYVFRVTSADGRSRYYIGQYQSTDKSGVVAFDLPDGSYQVLVYASNITTPGRHRVSWKWSGVFKIPPSANVVIKID